MLEIPYPVTRPYVVHHRELYFIYGHDVARHGTFGQAWDLHGEPNTHSVYTCHKMCKTSAYFSDGDLHNINGLTDAEISDIETESFGRPIIVLPKIGRGYSRMFEFSPKAYAYLIEQLNKIKYKDMMWKY